MFPRRASHSSVSPENHSHSCLTATLRLQVEQKLQDGFVTRVNVAQLADEAKRRLIMAMFMDSMEIDGE